MLSSLSYAILALLASKAQSGYDIARQMRPPLGVVWQAKHGQIYPELARLVQAGLVEVERVDAGSGPPRRIHSITPAGKNELTNWIATAPQTRPINDELVVKAYALRRVSPRAAASLLREQIESHDKRLAALEQLLDALERRISRRTAMSSPQFGDYAAVRRAIGFEREQIVWCRWLLEQVSTSSTKGPRARGSRQLAVRKPEVAPRRPAAKRTARTVPRSPSS